MARKQKKYHYLYKTTNNLNGKYYYGMHSTDDLNDGYYGSGKRLRYSINKYGKENHSVEVLEFFENRIDLKNKEKEIINLNEIAKKDCMNLVVGGGGGLIGLSEDKRENIRNGASKFLKEKWKDPSYRKMQIKLSSERIKKTHKEGKLKYNNFKNKYHNEESKRKMSESSKGMGKGKSNSQYGTCWITKNDVNKKIKLFDLNDYIKNDWIKGRII